MMSQVTGDLPHVAGVEHRFVDAGGVRLHVAEAGAGEPLLLIHGWPQHWYMWRRVVPLLAPHFRLIMPDNRGFGWSDAPGSGYHPEVFAADALAVLAELGVDRARVIGHDWGGFAAFMLALRRPDRLNGLVVCNCPPPWVRITRRVLASGWRLWYAAAVASPLGPHVLQRPGPWLGTGLRLGGRQAVFPDDAIEVYAARLREPARARASSELYRNYLRVTRQVGLGGRYRDEHLRVPALLLFGEDDYFVPRAYLNGYRRNAPGMKVELVRGVSHWTPEEAPEVVARRAREHFG